MLFRNSFANTAKNIFGNVQRFGAQIPSFISRGISTLNTARDGVKKIQDIKGRVDSVGRQIASDVPENIQKTARDISGRVDSGLNRAGSEIDRASRIGSALSGLF